MSRAFDLFLLLTLFILVSGGCVIRSPHFFLDLASVDSFAMAALVLLGLAWKKIPVQSRLFQFFSHELQDEYSVRNSKIFFVCTFALLFLAHVAKHWSLLTDGFDVSFVHQALFHPFTHPFMQADISRSGSALGEHILLSMVPLALVTEFLRSDELLFLVQVLSIATPLYFLIYKIKNSSKITPWIWLAVMGILSNASLRNSLIFDFREDAFAFLGLTIALLSLMNARLGWYFGGLIFALLSKEHVFIVTLALAPAILWSPDFKLEKTIRIRVALATGIVSLVYGFIAFKFLIPYFNPELLHSSPIVARLHQFGDTPAQIIMNLAVHPQNWITILKNILTRGSLIYLAKMLLPFAPFIFFTSAWWVALPGWVGLALNVLTGYPLQSSMQFHYDLFIFPFLFTAFLLGIEKLKPNPQKTLAFILLALCFSSKWPVYELIHFFPSPAQVEARIEMLKLDRHLPVTTNTHLSAQMNQQDELFILDANCIPYNLKIAKPTTGYVVVDQHDPHFKTCAPLDGTPNFKNSEIEIYKR